MDVKIMQAEKESQEKNTLLLKEKLKDKNLMPIKTTIVLDLVEFFNISEIKDIKNQEINTDSIKEIIDKQSKFNKKYVEILTKQIELFGGINLFSEIKTTSFNLENYEKEITSKIYKAKLLALNEVFDNFLKTEEK